MRLTTYNYIDSRVVVQVSVMLLVQDDWPTPFYFCWFKRDGSSVLVQLVGSRPCIFDGSISLDQAYWCMLLVCLMLGESISWCSDKRMDRIPCIYVCMNRLTHGTCGG